MGKKPRYHDFQRFWTNAQVAEKIAKLEAENGSLHVDIDALILKCNVIEAGNRKLREKNERLKKAGIGYSQQTVDALTAERDKLIAENERQENALIKIQTWAKAYPLDIFPKPDLKKARQVLKAAGMTLDAISTDAMRHVISGVTDIVEQALKGKY